MSEVTLQNSFKAKLPSYLDSINALKIDYESHYGCYAQLQHLEAVLDQDLPMLKNLYRILCFVALNAKFAGRNFMVRNIHTIELIHNPVNREIAPARLSGLPQTNRVAQDLIMATVCILSDVMVPDNFLLLCQSIGQTSATNCYRLLCAEILNTAPEFDLEIRQLLRLRQRLKDSAAYYNHRRIRAELAFMASKPEPKLETMDYLLRLNNTSNLQDVHSDYLMLIADIIRMIHQQSTSHDVFNELVKNCRANLDKPEVVVQILKTAGKPIYQASATDSD